MTQTISAIHNTPSPSHRFEYGVARIKDIQVKSTTTKDGDERVTEVRIGDRPVQPSKRFWNSLHMRFGFTANIFRYFSHEEVFKRISEVSANDQIRWCLATDAQGKSTALAVTNPNSAIVQHDDLTALLQRYGAEKVHYHDGVVTSQHDPRLNSTFAIAGDDFQNKFVLDTPIDGYGKPSVFLAMLRLVCTNGAIAMTQAFRSELNLGRGASGEFALVRVLDGFNNEEGFAALRQRFESATRSWASVGEVNTLYRTLLRLSYRGTHATPTVGSDGAVEGGSRNRVLKSFQQLTGNLAELYGLANLDALSAKRQRTLPTPCTVYDLLNFSSEVATHHAGAGDHRALHSYLGDLISGEFDLEGTIDQFGDWKDFFIGHEKTTETLTEMHRK